MHSEPSSRAQTTLNYEVFVSDPIPVAGAPLPDGQQPTWSPLSTTMIYGEKDAVLVDPPITREQTRRVGDWFERTGKRLTHIYITHGHIDHWFGTATLVERFPGATVCATPGTIRSIDGQSEMTRKVWEAWFPSQLPEKTLIVADPVPTKGIELEGHQLIPVEVGHSDTDDSTVLHVPSIGLVVAGDVVYNGVHQFLAEGGHGGLSAWERAIDTVDALRPKAVVAGHKNKELPDDPSALEHTRQYLRDAQLLVDNNVSTLEFFEAMLSQHPYRLNPATVWLSANRLHN